jgi:hypothetical protein
MVTAYDFPSAVHVARAGIDVVLVGDSAAMVELGYETTQPITLDQIINHCQAVKRGVEYAAPSPLLVGDMPFGTYEFEDTDVALRNAYRMVKEAGIDAVKLEVRDMDAVITAGQWLVVAHALTLTLTLFSTLRCLGGQSSPIANSEKDRRGGRYVRIIAADDLSNLLPSHTSLVSCRHGACGADSSGH